MRQFSILDFNSILQGLTFFLWRQILGFFLFKNSPTKTLSFNKGMYNITIWSDSH